MSKQRSTMTIKTDLAEKLRIIKEENYCASMNEVIESLLPYAVNENLKFKRELPAFTLVADENNTLDVSFYELRHVDVGKTWSVANDDYGESATLLFCDEQGAFIRFCNSDDQVSVMYYHYLK